MSHGRSFIVALVVPSKIHLESMAHKKLSKVTGSWSDLCEDQEVEAEVLKQLTDHAKKSKQVSPAFILLLLRHLQNKASLIDCIPLLFTTFQRR